MGLCASSIVQFIEITDKYRKPGFVAELCCDRVF